MVSIKCPTCGGKCNFDYEKGYVCEFCLNVYSSAENSDSITDKINYANTKRIENYDFEGALELCFEVLRENPKNQIANWEALLAEYQIVYLQNAKGNFKPTLLNPNVSMPINKCSYYKNLNSDFREMADFAEAMRLEVISASQHIPDYDVFISYKQHVDKSDTIATEEAQWAAEIYKRLSKSGLRVFYDEVSLNEGTAGWEPHIYSALKSAKYLIVLGSSAKNINSTWVKNEWKRFIYYRKNDSNKTFTVVRKNLKPEELDLELQSQQMIDVDKGDWIDKLVKKVTEHLIIYKVKFLLDEAEAFILKRKFKKAQECYSKICNADPRNASGYWGLLMCKLKAMDDYDLVKRRKKIGKTKEYDNAVRYAVGEDKLRYEKVGSDNLKHNTIGYERKNYKDWRDKTKVSRFFKKFFIILIVVLLCISIVLGWLWYKDLKSKEYSFQLDYRESTGMVTSIKVHYGEEIPELPNNLTIDDKYYMDFVGWFTQPECKGIKVADKDGKTDATLDSKITSLSNGLHQIKLYAGFEVHKYMVTFYDDDSHTILKSIKVEYGTNLDEIGKNIFVGDKQVLTWSEKPNGSDFSGKITNDISLYASSFAIKVEYDSNGGNDVSTAIIRVGDKVPMPIPERQYYGFEGWSYKDNIVPYGFVAPQENITLVAQWSKTHFSLIRDSNGGLDDSKEMIKAGNIVSLPVLTRQYYRFIGWEYNGSIVDNSFIMPKRDVILTAKWEKTHYAVSLDGIVQYVRIGESITLPTKNKPGYEFEGWETDGKLSNGTYTPTDDIAITSVFKPYTYIVSLNANGGNVTSAMVEVKYDSIYKLPVPMREGYEFIGWYTSANSSGQKKTNKEGNSISKWNWTSDLTLYAIWITDYSIDLERKNCKFDNGYSPDNGGTSNEKNSHKNWELAKLIVSNGAKNADGTFYLPQGQKLVLNLRLLQDISSLPRKETIGANWYASSLSEDNYEGKVFETNLAGKRIGFGAYYLKINFQDGTYMEVSNTQVFKNAKKDSQIEINLDGISSKPITSIEFTLVYEIKYEFYNGWWWTEYSNWRCSTILEFK